MQRKAFISYYESQKPSQRESRRGMWVFRFKSSSEKMGMWWLSTWIDLNQLKLRDVLLGESTRMFPGRINWRGRSFPGVEYTLFSGSDTVRPQRKVSPATCPWPSSLLAGEYILPILKMPCFCHPWMIRNQTSLALHCGWKASNSFGIL